MGFPTKDDDTGTLQQCKDVFLMCILMESTLEKLHEVLMSDGSQTLAIR